MESNRGVHRRKFCILPLSIHFINNLQFYCYILTFYELIISNWWVKIDRISFLELAVLEKLCHTIESLGCASLVLTGRIDS